MTATLPRLDLLAAGLLQPSDRVVCWHTGDLATCPIDAARHPEWVEWRTVVAVDVQGADVRLTFDQGEPVTVGADEDVVAIAA